MFNSPNQGPHNFSQTRRREKALASKIAASEEKKFEKAAQNNDHIQVFSQFLDKCASINLACRGKSWPLTHLSH